LEEFWVCQHCHSLNRSGNGKCYHCKKRFGTAPPAVETLARPGSKPPVVLPGGRSGDSGRSGEPAQYMSRPVSVSPPPGLEGANSFTERYRAAEAEARKPFFLRIHPLAPISRRVSWWLAMRQSVSVSWLGYLTAGLLTLLLVVGVLLMATLGPSAISALQTASLEDAWAKLDAGHQTSLTTLAIAFGALAILSLICFSVFVALTTHNAPGLGAPLPILTPRRAGTCWWSVLRAQFLLALGLLVPGLLFWLGYPLPGAIAAFVFLQIGHRRIDDPFGWMSRPARHLTDLFAKLGTQKSGGSAIASVWATCFRAANVFFILASSLPLLGLLLGAVSVAIDNPEVRGWHASGFGPAQIAVALVIGSAVAWLAASLALVVPLVIELVERQRARKTLVRVGRARPWVAHPTESAEREPRRPGVYDPYAPLEDDDDQASLYSPSTTPSSLPWSRSDDRRD
jgi:hypothetical protein